MNSNRNLWITLLVLLLIVCCCCCALAWGAGSLALGGIRMGASAIGPDMGGWQQWFRSFGGRLARRECTGQRADPANADGSGASDARSERARRRCDRQDGAGRSGQGGGHEARLRRDPSRRASAAG